VKTKDTTEVYQLVERALDEAMLNQKFLFKMYNYLKQAKWTRRETNDFIESSTAAQLSNTVEELNGYIKGGDPVLREAYGHIPKPKARKIRDYLYSILEGAWQYHAERKPGRRKKVAK
jgi:hypothetical protein|tara:strand:+ start:6869 stop:7222 length:354 start_codon:yes stop_codon:yes gene_type:complete